MTTEELLKKMQEYYANPENLAKYIEGFEERQKQRAIEEEEWERSQRITQEWLNREYF